MNGIQYWECPQILLPLVENFLKDRYKRIFFVVSSQDQGIEQLLMSTIISKGYRLKTAFKRKEAGDTVYEYEPSKS